MDVEEEPALIVQLPPNLCLEDLIELKCSAPNESIQLTSFDPTFVNVVDRGKKVKTNIDPDPRDRFVETKSPVLGADGRYACPLCSKTFSQKHIVPRHIKSVHENFYHQCDQCHQFVRNLQQHRRYRHSGNQNVRCNLCGLEKSSKRELRDHLKYEHGEICVPASLPVKPRPCPTCGVVLHTKKSLWQGHIYPQHMVPRQYFQCPLPSCPRSVSKVEDDHSLRLHLATHHNLQVERVFHCQLCPQKMLSEQDLNNHQDLHHKGAQVVSCVLCQEAFPTFQLMALHVYQVHKNVFRGWEGCNSTVVEFRVDQLQKTTHVSNSFKYTTIQSSSSVGEKVTTPLNLPVIDMNSPLNDDHCEDLRFEEGDSEIDPISSPTSSDESSCDGGSLLSNCRLPEGTRLIKATNDEIHLEIDGDCQKVIQSGAVEIEGSENASHEVAYSLGVDDHRPIGTDLKEKFLMTHTEFHDDSVIHPQHELHVEPVSNEEKEESVQSIKETHNNGEVRRRHGRKGSGQFKCTWRNCDKTFVARHSVKVHMRAVHLAPPGGVACAVCGKKYRTRETMRLHVKTVHEAVEAACSWPGCGKVLASHRQMRSHLLKHSEKPKQCPHCNSILKNANVLRMHIKKIHGKQSMYLMSNKDFLKAPDDKVSQTLLETKPLAVDEAPSHHSKPTITTYKLR